MTDTSSHIVFAYGTLLDPEVQQRLFGQRLFTLGPATLYGWKRFSVTEYPYIQPSNQDNVSGQLLLLSTQQLLLADEWEEYPEIYQRELLQVSSVQGNLYAWAYTRRNA